MVEIGKELISIPIPNSKFAKHLKCYNSEIRFQFLVPKHTIKSIEISSTAIKSTKISSQPDLEFTCCIASANKLWNLTIPGSLISNDMVVKVSKKLSNLTHLDLSYNTKIDANSIAAIGRYCKKLTHFQRKMSPFLIPFQKPQDDETLAIAAMMPHIKHLELNYLFITTEGVLRIIKNCLELEFLDIGGCWNVDIDADCELLTNRLKLKVVNEVSGEVDDSHFNYTAIYLDEYVYPQDLNDL